MTAFTRGLISGTIIGAFLWMIFIALATAAVAHDAPEGWSYDTSCCNTTDCRQVSGPASKSLVKVVEISTGYKIMKPDNTQEIINFGDSRIRESKDGEYHWCSAAGLDNTNTICLYIPHRDY